MAVLKNSPLEGLTGTLGDVVFRSWNGKTYAYLKSAKPRKESAAQKRTRDKFREASMRAKLLLEDREMQQHYNMEALRLKLPNAYTAALKELMSAVNI